MDGFTAMINSGVQIHHLKDHWVASSCLGGQVSVYDSSLNGKLSVELTHQLAAVYKLNACTDADHRSYLVVKTPAVQHQLGGKDCGVFVIAFAYHATRGDDISSFTFDQTQMRRHLVTCFLIGKMSPFPRLHDRHGAAGRREVTSRSGCSASALCQTRRIRI